MLQATECHICKKEILTTQAKALVPSVCSLEPVQVHLECLIKYVKTTGQIREPRTINETN